MREDKPTLCSLSVSHVYKIMFLGTGEVLRFEAEVRPKLLFKCTLRSFTLLCMSEHCCFCTGPYQVNGVPLRRVNQAYVIATSMAVDVSKVTVPVVDDSYFTREAVAKKSEEDQFFEQASKVHFTVVVASKTGPVCDTERMPNSLWRKAPHLYHLPD